jgi:hypothetical protein
MTSEVKFRVGKYTCHVTVPEIRPGEVSHATVEWEPRMPDRLSDAEMEQYEAGMLAALSGATRGTPS